MYNKPGAGRSVIGVLGGLISVFLGIVMISVFFSSDGIEDLGVGFSIVFGLLGVVLLAAAVNDMISIFSQRYRIISERVEMKYSALIVAEIVLLSLCTLFLFCLFIFTFDEDFRYEYGDGLAFVLSIAVVLSIIDAILIIVSQVKLMRNKKNGINPYVQQGGYYNPNQPSYGYGNIQQPNVAQNPYGVNVPQPNVAQNPYGANVPQPNVAQNPYGVNVPQPNVAQNPYGANVPQPNVAQNPYGANVPQPNGIQSPYGNENIPQYSGSPNPYSGNINKVSLNKDTYDPYNNQNGENKY